MPFSLKSTLIANTVVAMGCLSISTVAFAQFPAQQQTQAQQPTYSGNQPVKTTGSVQMKMLPERLSPQMLNLLKVWESKTAGIETLQGTFRRYEYDSVFMTEKRAVGRYWFGSPDKARMDFQPDPDVVKALEKNPEEKLVHQFNGKNYSVEAEKTTSWICTGKEILEINHGQKQYSKMEIPPQFHGQRITDGPMPFLFGMKADSVTKRYKMAFGSKHDPNSQVHIIAYPIVPALQKEFQRAEILLDPNTFLPQAVKLWDPAGSKETTYMFYTPKPFSIITDIKGPWSAYLGPPWKCIADIKADPNQLPMQEQRGASKFPLRRTAADESDLRTQ